MTFTIVTTTDILTRKLASCIIFCSSSAGKFHRAFIHLIFSSFPASAGRAGGPPVVVAFSVFYDTFLQKNISAVSSSDKSRTSDILNISIRVKSLIPLVFFDHEDFEILTSDRNSPTEYPFIFILAISKFLFTSLSNVPHLRLCLLRYFHIITHSPSCKSFWTLFFSFVQFR